MRIAALGGTAFLVAMLVAPARADWSVKRTSREPLIDQIARALEARPTDSQLATHLARAAPKSTVERLLGEFAARAEHAGGDPTPLLAYAQLLLAAGRAPDAARAFERTASAAEEAARGAPTTASSAATRVATQVSIYEGWAMALRSTGDRAQAVTI